MTTTISGDASADFATPLPVTDGGTGASTSVGSGSVMLSAQTGSAPVFGARAWCYFNGATTGTNAPIAGGNVTTVTRNSTGNYTINFTTAMPDTNYGVHVTNAHSAGNATYAFEVAGSRTTTSVQVQSYGGGTVFDSANMSVTIVR